MHRNPRNLSEIITSKPKLRFDEKCFAMLHCGSAIKNTQWEGGQNLNALEYSQELLNIPDHPVDLGLSHEHFGAINAAFDEVTFFHHLFNNFKKNETDELNIDLEDLINEILIRCKKNGYCYLPSGWTGDESGHFAILKLRHLEGHIFAASLLNRGSGVKFHRPSSQGDHKLKRDYQSYEYRIDLASSLGEFFLSGLIHLYLDRRPFDKKEYEIRQEKNSQGTIQSIKLASNNKTIQHYSETDLYGLLIFCGKKIESPLCLEAHAATVQRTGTCTITTTGLLIQDVLVSQFSFTCDQIRRVKFSLKLTSLVEGNKAHHLNKGNSGLITWALREFHVRIHKVYPEILMLEEMNLCCQIGGEILVKPSSGYLISSSTSLPIYNRQLLYINK